jgi:hypothetical protein
MGSGAISCRQAVKESVLRVRIHLAPANRHKPSVLVAVRSTCRPNKFVAGPLVSRDLQLPTVHMYRRDSLRRQYQILHGSNLRGALGPHFSFNRNVYKG